MSSESHFRYAVQAALREVPLQSRKTWDENDLSRWFFAERSNNKELHRFEGDGEPWQHLKVICRTLIGDKAVD